jgi:hypothetical protein
MNTATQIDTQRHAHQRDAFMEQLVGAVNGFFMVYGKMGPKMGLSKI